MTSRHTLADCVYRAKGASFCVLAAAGPVAVTRMLGGNSTQNLAELPSGRHQKGNTTHNNFKRKYQEGNS